MLIAGDADHPEVEGIRGHCVGPSYVFKNEEELSLLYRKFDKLFGENYPIIVSQTTFNHTIWGNCIKTAKKDCTNTEIYDTICSATAIRQEEAISLAQHCDLMVIVGGKQSSNTAKLRDVCAQHCPTVLIETAQELTTQMLQGAKTVGLTAGASTPADSIKEVYSTMSEILNSNETTATEEFNFAEELEASLQSFHMDVRAGGVVTATMPSEVQVEVIGRKQTGYIPVDELSATPGTDPHEVVKVGDELELLIMRTNDQEGTIMLSKRRVDSLKGWDTVVNAEANGDILEGVVTEVIKGGVLVVTNGVRVFVPASQASLHRMDDFTPLLKTEVRFKVIEVNTARRRAVGSIRAVAREERKALESQIWEQLAVGQVYTGTVKSLTSYGAFVDIGGVDGMVHISELSWKRVKHPSEVVSVGDVIEVYVRDLDADKKKISLGYRKAEDNPWEIFKNNYDVDSVVEVKIVGLTSFGAFAQIIPGIDGLIHISQIANRRIEKTQDELKVGQVVTAKITAIDWEKKHISLSIRALLSEEEAAEEVAEEAAEEVSEEVASEE